MSQLDRDVRQRHQPSRDEVLRDQYLQVRAVRHGRGHGERAPVVGERGLIVALEECDVAEVAVRALLCPAVVPSLRER